MSFSSCLCSGLDIVAMLMGVFCMGIQEWIRNQCSRKEPTTRVDSDNVMKEAVGCGLQEKWVQRLWHRAGREERLGVGSVFANTEQIGEGFLPSHPVNQGPVHAYRLEGGAWGPWLFQGDRQEPETRWGLSQCWILPVITIYQYRLNRKRVALVFTAWFKDLVWQSPTSLHHCVSTRFFVLLFYFCLTCCQSYTYAT